MKKVKYYLTKGDYTLTQIDDGKFETSEMLFEDPTSVDCPVTFDSHDQAIQFAKEHNLNDWEVSYVTTEWDDEDDSDIIEIEEEE